MSESSALPSHIGKYSEYQTDSAELAWVVNGEVLCILQFIPAFFRSKDVLFYGQCYHYVSEGITWADILTRAKVSPKFDFKNSNYTWSKRTHPPFTRFLVNKNK